MSRRSPLGHGPGMGRELLQGLQAEVARRLARFGDELQVRVMRGWISFRSQHLQRVFAELRPHRRDVEAFILPPTEALDGSSSLASSSPPTQGWGWFRSKFRLSRWEDVEAASDLVFQSYLFRKQMVSR